MDIQLDADISYIEDLDSASDEIDIKVTEGVQRSHGLSSYIGYIIKVNLPQPIVVERRYRQFDALRQILILRWPGILIPPLPRKHTTGSNTLKVVNQRLKYLTYFLNNCARNKFIFLSQQFQIFLTSPSNLDLKKKYDKMPKLTYQNLLQRYKDSFLNISVQQTQRKQMAIQIAQQILPFMKHLQDQHINLVNMRKQVYFLAVKKEQYLIALSTLYNQAIPSLENHYQTCNNDTNMIIKDNIKIKQQINEINLQKAKPYWILFQALKLQVLEAQAAIQAIKSRIGLQRQVQITKHTIQVNEQELLNIKNKRMTLKQFFNLSNQNLQINLQKQTLQLKNQLQALQLLTLIVNKIILINLLTNYKQKRQKLWRKAFLNFINMEKQFNQILIAFYKLI